MSLRSQMASAMMTQSENTSTFGHIPFERFYFLDNQRIYLKMGLKDQSIALEERCIVYIYLPFFSSSSHLQVFHYLNVCCTSTSTFIFSYLYCSSNFCATGFSNLNFSEEGFEWVHYYCPYWRNITL